MSANRLLVVTVRILLTCAGRCFCQKATVDHVLGTQYLVRTALDWMLHRLVLVPGVPEYCDIENDLLRDSVLATEVLVVLGQGQAGCPQQTQTRQLESDLVMLG